MVENPFVTTGYIGPEYFCDREKETEDLVRLLSNGNNIALISPRRYGKTDLLRHCFAQPAIANRFHTFIVDIYSTLSEYTTNITVYDPWADIETVKREYNIDVTNVLSESDKYTAVVLGVAHSCFSDLDIKSLVENNGIVYDVKGVLPRDIIDGRL